MLDYNELIDLEEELQFQFSEHLTEILVKLNRTERIEEFLDLIGLSNLLGQKNDFESYKSGKIFVIGGTELTEKVFNAVAKDFGIASDRFEYCLGYKEAKKFDCRKLQWRPDIAAVMVGPMPHSGSGKGDYSSIITALEKEEGYPPIVRLGTNELKITKSGFRNALNELIEKKMII